MFDSLKRLSLGIGLIALASGILLYSDRRSRNRIQQRLNQRAVAEKQFRVALVEHASQPALEDGTRGVTEALAARGYAEGGRLLLRRYNAEGDWAIANSIAKDVVGGTYDLIITISTPSLQTVANANKFGSKTPHVFGLVSDPYSAGVGINPTNHLDHPPYLAGYGTMQPVADAFKMARQLRPELRTVGLAWNPTESNSQAQTRLARVVCAELGITLLEANAENTIGVAEAANSLTARGVEAFWLSGDVTVLTAADALIAAARRGKIPVFTVIPPMAKKGALFDLGANYYEIGKATGNLAADVLDGRSPAEIPVENLLVESLVVNRLALEGLKDRWQLPESVVQRASIVIDASGTHSRLAATEPLRIPAGRNFQTGPKPGAAIKPPARKVRVDFIEYLDTPNVEVARQGVFDAFQTSGWQKGVHFDLRLRNAQGDVATLSSMVDAAVTDDTELIITSTTPALQVALRRGRGKPLVFTLVANPSVVGAGKSDTDHLPFVTGSYVEAPFKEALEALKACVPNIKRIGTLYVPGEVNSVYYRDQLLAAAKKVNLELETVGVSATGDVPDAALALCGRGIDVFCQLSDNLTGASFTSIGQAAKKARVPLMGFANGQARRGAFMTLSCDFYDNGVASGRLAMRVLSGESPAQIPFEAVTKLQFVINLAAAAELGITVPDRLVKKADEVIR
jgi:ABC-type uncharacterized transport system substrate-binding protein